MDYAARIAQDEGFRSRPYKDSQGVLTIGYGLNLDEGITQDEAEWLLEQRVGRAIKDCYYRIPFMAKLDDSRQYVLINMAYNMGISRLLGFSKMLLAIENGDYKEAAREMLDSLWAKQVPARAERLTAIMKGDV